MGFVHAHPTWRYVHPVQIEDPACAKYDPEWWFPEAKQTPWKALAICGGCKGLEQCAAYAMRHPELDGVWGGMTAKDRQRRRVNQASTPA